MWRFVAPRPEHRCIIPLTGFCEAEGEKGSKTRTWFSVKDQPIFAWAGMWKDSAEWGAVYSGLMTDCNEAVRPVHDRMPVLLHVEDYDRWLRGPLEDVIAFQDRCYPDDAYRDGAHVEPLVQSEGGSDCGMTTVSDFFKEPAELLRLEPEELASILIELLHSHEMRGRFTSANIARSALSSSSRLAAQPESTSRYLGDLRS